MGEIVATLDWAAKNSAETFIENLAILDNSDIKFEESIYLAERFRDFLKCLPSELLLKSLLADDCQDFLGVHAAKFGRLEHQISYLFGSSHNLDAYINRINLRSKYLKNMF